MIDNTTTHPRRRSSFFVTTCQGKFYVSEALKFASFLPGHKIPSPAWFVARCGAARAEIHFRGLCHWTAQETNLFLVTTSSPGAFYGGNFKIALNSTTRRHPRLGLVAGSRGPTQIHIRGLCHWAGEPAGHLGPRRRVTEPTNRRARKRQENKPALSTPIARIVPGAVRECDVPVPGSAAIRRARRVPGGPVATKRRAQLIKEIFWTPLTLTPAFSRQTRRKTPRQKLRREQMRVLMVS